MTDSELDDIERKAKAATPGPWEAPDHPESVVDVWTAEPLRAIDDRAAKEWDHPTAITPSIRGCDGAFIAAANPQAVLALVAEVRQLRALRAALLPEFQRHNESYFCTCFLCSAFAAMAQARPDVL